MLATIITRRFQAMAPRSLLQRMQNTSLLFHYDIKERKLDWAFQSYPRDLFPQTRFFLAVFTPLPFINYWKNQILWQYGFAVCFTLFQANNAIPRKLGMFQGELRVIWFNSSKQYLVQAPILEFSLWSCL